MKIAYTYNLQSAKSDADMAFDRPETVDAIFKALTALGHQVDRIEVLGSVSRLTARLEALRPELIFNTAVGRGGKSREAFYPGLFEQLGIPCTGSSARACTLTTDKRLTKMLVAESGVPTPRWVFVESVHNWTHPTLNYPVIIKPNYESSSKGIDQQSVVETPELLLKAVTGLLTQYPAGVLIEEFIAGKDVVVPFLENASRKTGGVLAPGEYCFDPSVVSDHRHIIYHDNLQPDPGAVTLKVPMALPPKIAEQVLSLSQTICRVLDIRDLARLDYRLTDDGQVFFIEANALPSLEPGTAIHVSASLAGIATMEAVLNTVIQSAVARYGIQLAVRSRNRQRTLKIGFTFNLKRIKPLSTHDDDSEAEYDSRTTIDAITGAISSYGHEVVEIEATPELPTLIGSIPLDIVFNIAEGLHGRNRESQVPAILELLNIPYVGSDPAALSICLDKALAKKMVRQVGIFTPDFIVMHTGKERLPRNFQFPVIIKPIAEGSSKGVMGINVVQDEAELRWICRELLSKYHQPVLVEAYLCGREFTVGLLGENRLKVLPPMEIIFNNKKERFPVYAFEHKLDTHASISYQVPANIDRSLQKNLKEVAKCAFMALGCRDVARVDLRLDQAERIHFIECNPLPGLTPGWSDLCLIGEAAGMDYRTLIGEIMAPAIRRLKFKEKPQMISY
jgi:D-alanine--D-alanine ligase